jgi:hypothetical protein
LYKGINNTNTTIESPLLTVTQVKMGAECEKGYTSHVTLVTKKLVTEDQCTTLPDYQKLRGLTSYFPVVEVTLF